MEKIDKILDSLGFNKLDEIAPLKKFCDKIHVPTKLFAAGVTAILLLLVVLEVSSLLVCGIIGFLYPAYMSFKALETKENSDDDKLWLTYWVVFSFVTVFDDILHFVLSFIPMYNLLKVAFYISLFHPRTMFAVWIYNNAILPLLKKYDKDIQAGIDKVAKQAGNLTEKAENAAKLADQAQQFKLN